MFFFFNDTATTEIYTLSLHDALPISLPALRGYVGAKPSVTRAYLRRNLLPAVKARAEAISVGTALRDREGAGQKRRQDGTGERCNYKSLHSRPPLFEDLYDVERRSDLAAMPRPPPRAQGAHPAFARSAERLPSLRGARRAGVSSRGRGSRSEERRVGKECRSRW